MNLFGLEIRPVKDNSVFVRLGECMRVHATLDKALDERFKNLKEHIDTKIEGVKDLIRNGHA